MTLPVCPHCGNHYEPEGKETACWECLEGTAFPKDCCYCGNRFYASDPFEMQCAFCASESNHRNRQEADYHFDASTDT